MVNKSILLVSGLVLGLSFGADASAGKKANQELDYEFRGPINRYFKTVGKPSGSKRKPAPAKIIVKKGQERAGWVPGSFKDIEPGNHNSSDRGFLYKNQPAE